MKRLFTFVVASALCFPAINSQAWWQSIEQAGVWTGPGDVVSGASAWYGLRAYNAADKAVALNVCLPAGTSCTDVPLVNGIVAALPAALSTCNNTSVKCVIATIYDKAGTSNLTQATNGNRPVLVVPGTGNTCPQGTQFCISVAAGKSLCTATFNGSTTLNQPYTIVGFADSSPGNSAGGLPLFATNNNSGSPTQAALAGSTNTAHHTGVMDNYAGSNGYGINFVDAIWHNFVFLFNSTSSLQYIDNSASAGANGGTQAFNSGPTACLFIDTYGDNWAGYFSELGIWNVSLTPTQVANLNSNVQSFYSPFAFENTGASQPWSSNSFGSSKIYDPTSGKVWLFWDAWFPVGVSYERVPQVMTCTQSACSAAANIGTGNILPSTDPHGMPACAIDAAEYFYCIYGGHDTQAGFLVATTSPNNPSGWSATQVSVSAITFPEPWIVGGIFYMLYTTTGTGGGRQESIGMEVCTVSAGVYSGCSTSNLFDATAASSWLTPDNSVIDPNGTEIDMVLSYGSAGIGNTQTNKYFARYNTSTGAVCNYARSTCIASGSQPGTLAQLNASFALYTGTNVGGAALLVDSGSTAHVALGDDVSSSNELLYLENSGSGWGSPTVLFTYPGTLNAAAAMASLDINSSNQLEAYFSDASAGNGTPGGNIQKTVRISGTWQTPTIVLAQQSTVNPLDLPVPVISGPSWARQAFTEAVPNYVTPNGGLRGYLYGESGFIANPAGL